MKGTILIPIDFTIGSLNLLKEALRNNSDQPRPYLLMFEMNIGDSITDLLFLSKLKLVESYTNKQFNEGLDILKNRYSEVINSLRIEPFYGFTKGAFRNFLDANQVEEAYMPSYELISKKHTSLKSTFSFLTKLDIPLSTVDFSSDVEQYPENSLLQLFND